jgi:Xaa-Pro aminopeptidase
MTEATVRYETVPVPSSAERERRLSLVRERMRDEMLDVLVCACDNHQRGDVRYLTAHSIWSQRAYAVVAPDGLPSLVVSMTSQQYWAKQRPDWVQDVRSRRPPIAEVVAVLRGLKKEPARIGVSGLDEHMPIGDYDAMRAAFPVAEIVDATELMQVIRTDKSAEEIELIRHSADIAVAQYQRAKEVAAPGVTETDLFAEIDAIGRRRGVVSTIMLTSNGPYLREPAPRVMQEGDLQMVSVEIAGPTGYWIEFGGTLPIGQLSDGNSRLLQAAEVAFDAGVAAVRVGARCSDVADAVAATLAEAGFGMGIWGGHGIGLDTVEGPRLLPTDTSEIRENMVFGFHPHLIDEESGVGAYVANTVLATPDGGLLLASERR